MTTSEDKHRSSGDVVEKPSSNRLEDVDVDGSSRVVDPDDFGFNQKEQRSIIRRVDRRLVVTVGLMYCISLMDRINMSFANIAGMGIELDLLRDYRYVSTLLQSRENQANRVRTLPTSSSSSRTSSSSRRRPFSSAGSDPVSTSPSSPCSGVPS